jgi:hypothetical protein
LAKSEANWQYDGEECY